jgi:ABC-type antimicrobial peptide transport system permease subunit
VLAVVGLYGVAARGVADRRRELAIRVALGARPATLRALVLRDGIQTVGPAAAGLPQRSRHRRSCARFYTAFPTAPHVFLLTSVALAAAAVAATFLPAQRASRVDPIIALRE